MLKAKLFALAAVAGIFAVATPSFAAFLPPASILFPLPSEADNPAAGTLLATTGAAPFSTATYSGTLTSEVYIGDPTNPYGLNALTFTYVLNNDALSTNSLERLTVTDFTGFLTDVSNQLGSPGIAATYADRTTADVVGFSFLPAPGFPGTLTPGSFSTRLVIQTNATAFDSTVANVIDGSIAPVTSFAPIPAIGAPEPASLTVAALGSAVLLLRRRRRA